MYWYRYINYCKTISWSPERLPRQNICCYNLQPATQVATELTDVTGSDPFDVRITLRFT